MTRTRLTSDVDHYFQEENPAGTTVVLLGDVGSGKSTIVEKLLSAGSAVKHPSWSGDENFLDNVDENFALCSQAYLTSDGALQIIATPGANRRAGCDSKARESSDPSVPFESRTGSRAERDTESAGRGHDSVWIAHALCSVPHVNCMLLVFKLFPCLEQTLGELREYVRKFRDFRGPLLGLCVTWLEPIDWTAADFDRFHRILFVAARVLGISSGEVIFVGRETDAEHLKDAVLCLCGSKKAQDLSIDGGHFPNCFPTIASITSGYNDQARNNEFKILRAFRDEADRFKKMKSGFLRYLRLMARLRAPVSEKIDLVFEFQAFVLEEMSEAQKRASAKCALTFDCSLPNDLIRDSNHIGNLVNQLSAVMLPVDNLAEKYHTVFENSVVRKCPHCGQIWTRWPSDGDGALTCGAEIRQDTPPYAGQGLGPANKTDDRGDETGEVSIRQFASFVFEFRDGILVILRRPQMESSVEPAERPNGSQGGYLQPGCGATIRWTRMAPVTIPEEFMKTYKAIAAADIFGPRFQQWRTYWSHWSMPAGVSSPIGGTSVGKELGPRKNSLYGGKKAGRKKSTTGRKKSTDVQTKLDGSGDTERARITSNETEVASKFQ